MFLFIVAIKIIVSSAILMAYYWFLLRNKPFHKFNRIYLLGLVVFSILVPFIQLPFTMATAPTIQGFMYRLLDVKGGDFTVETETGIVVANNHNNMLIAVITGIYLLGAVIAGLLFIRALVKIILISQRANLNLWDGVPVYEVEVPQAPFTFMQSLYWHSKIDPESMAGQQIFQHELIHIKEKHSWDIFFMELVRIPLWFNPVYFLVKRELAVVHEFRADQLVSAVHGPIPYAETLLQHTISARKRRFIHSFFNHPIKRRILMLTQKNAGKSAIRPRLFSIPLVVLVFLSLILFANKASEPLVNTGHYLRETVIVVDAGHGGIDPGASANVGIKEKDINLAIAREVAKLGAVYKVKVVLTRNEDALPGNGSDIRESLIRRSDISNGTKADLFVSIHMSAGNEFHPGLQVIIPNQEKVPGLIAGAQSAGSILVAKLKTSYTTQEELLQPSQNIYVLNHSMVPAVLLHCGNISDPKDLAFVSNAANQEKIARNILEAAVAFGSSKQ